MAKSKKKKQQRLSAKRGRKSARRKTAGARKKRTHSAQQSTSVADHPIHETLISDSLFESGLGTGVFSRVLLNGDIAISSFLLDVFCLGVKDAFYTVVSLDEYHDIIARTEQSQTLVEIAPECLAKLVFGSVDYAQSLGFSPHKDYRKARKILDSVPVDDCDEVYEFGKDGKPFYVSGPYDTAAKRASIHAQLERSVGAGGFHFIHEIGEEEDIFTKGD